MNPRDGPTSFLEFNFSRKREKSVVNSWEHEIRSWIDRETHNTRRQSRETWQVCSGKNYPGVKCKTIIAAELKYEGLKHTEHLIWDHAKHIIWWEKPRNKANRDWRVIVKIYIFPHCCQFAAVGFVILLYILTWPYVIKRVSIFLWQGAFLFKGYCAISSKPTKQIEHAWRNLYWNFTVTSTRQYWNIWRRQWFSRSCGQNSNVADKKQHYLRFFLCKLFYFF